MTMIGVDALARRLTLARHAPFALVLRIGRRAGPFADLAGRDFALTLFDRATGDVRVSSAAGIGDDTQGGFAVMTLGAADATAAFGVDNVAFEIVELFADGKVPLLTGDVRVIAAAASAEGDGGYPPHPGGSLVIVPPNAATVIALPIGAPGLDSEVPGPPGPVPEIAIGDVITGAPGAPGDVRVRGTAEAPILDFDLPIAEELSITIGTVGATAPGGAPSAQLIGSYPDMALHLVLPRGPAASGTVGGAIEFVPKLFGELIAPGGGNGAIAWCTNEANGPGFVYYEPATATWRRLLTGVAASAGYDADAMALFARMTVAPSEPRKQLYSNFISALKAAGVWSRLACLYVMAAHDAQAGRLNLVGASNTLSGVNAPTFVADRGFNGDAATSYLDTGFNPAASALMLRDDNHLGVWIGSGSSNTANGSYTDIGSREYSINCRGGATTVTRNSSNGGDNVFAVSTALGWTCTSRDAAASYAVVRNLETPATATRSSIAQTASSIFIGARNDTGGAATYSPRRVAAAHWGLSLTDVQRDAFYGALNTYLTAVGGA